MHKHFLSLLNGTQPARVTILVTLNSIDTLAEIFWLGFPQHSHSPAQSNDLHRLKPIGIVKEELRLFCKIIKKKQ